jgi:hypothetical protein
MIAATAVANELPMYTCNPADFSGIDELEVVEVPLPEIVSEASVKRSDQDRGGVDRAGGRGTPDVPGKKQGPRGVLPS